MKANKDLIQRMQELVLQVNEKTGEDTLKGVCPLVIDYYKLKSVYSINDRTIFEHLYNKYTRR